MIDYNKFKIRYRGWEIDDEGNAGNCLDTWHWWNKIRFYTKLNKRIRVKHLSFEPKIIFT